MEASIEVLDGHSAQVATVPALVAAKSALVAKTLGIRNANQTQQKTTKGKTKDKEARKFTLADTAYSTAAAVQAYAAVTDNNDLFSFKEEAVASCTTRNAMSAKFSLGI